MINKESRRPSSTTYPLISDISAIELLTLEFWYAQLSRTASAKTSPTHTHTVLMFL